MSIAVVVVCRNALPALKRTVSSVLAAKPVPERLVVVDGGSSDGTAAHLGTLDRAMVHWVSEPDDGIYDAMNKGWSMAPAESHVLYLGAGDLLLQLPSAHELDDGSGRPHPVVLGQCDIDSMPFRSRWNREMHLRNTAHHQALLVHRSVSPQQPFDVGLRVYADWDFNLRLLGRGFEAVHVGSLRTRAESGGVSWRHDLREIRLVARRHGGPWVAAASWALNRWSLWRRESR
jgi:glycosyltransferase involved in cell wall biosynthesis